MGFLPPSWKYDGTGFPIYSAGFHDLPVCVTAGYFLLNGGHINQCIQVGHFCQVNFYNMPIRLTQVLEMW
jgi:hypothetical protein